MNWIGILFVSPLWGLLSSQLFVQIGVSFLALLVHLLGFLVGRVARVGTLLGAGASLFQMILFSSLLAGGQYFLAGVLHFGYSRAEGLVYWAVAIPYFVFLVVQAPSHLKRVWANAMEQGALETHISESAESRKLQTWRKGADEGDAFSQFLVGRAYAHGRGVPKDMARALQWYRKAADQGDSEAQLHLGCAYAKGDGVPKNATQAVEWYRKAADEGAPLAQWSLGVAYANGDGVRKDAVLACAWCNLAATRKGAMLEYDWHWDDYAAAEGWSGAAEHYSLALTAEERAEAERISSSWRFGQTLAREP